MKLESGVRLSDARPVWSGVFFCRLLAGWEVYRYKISLGSRPAVRSYKEDGESPSASSSLVALPVGAL